MKLGDLFIKLGLQKGDFDKGIDDAKRKTSAFGEGMKKIGGMIAGVFAVDQIVQFGKELLNIAGQAEGVISAFNRIGTSSDLQNLRTATKNTVSDLELMKRAVSANNFGIPIKELGRLFEFAAKRAQDTGQSVDYLVDSIVTGIGRKSPLILDNLGISAIQLKEKLGDVSMETASVADITRAVGDIAEESFSKSGRFADTLGTKIVSLQVKWDNFKLSLTQNEGFREFWSKEIDDFDKQLTILFSKNLTRWQKFKSLIDIFGNETDYLYNKAKLGEYVDNFLKQTDQESSGAPWEKTKTGSDPVVKTAKERLEAIQKLNDELEAQRILRQEFKGEKMAPITPLYQGVGDLMIQQPSDMGGVFGNLDSHYADITEKRKKWTAEELQGWIDFNDELNQIIESGISDAIGTMAAGFGEMLAMNDWDWSDFGSKILDSIGKFMQQFGAAMVAMGIAQLQLNLGMKTLNPALLIGGGAALIAAGAALSSLASQGMKGASAATSPASGYSNYSQSNAAAVISGNVVFELEGTKLRGALNNADRKNRYIR